MASRQMSLALSSALGAMPSAAPLHFALRAPGGCVVKKTGMLTRVPASSGVTQCTFSSPDENMTASPAAGRTSGPHPALDSVLSLLRSPSDGRSTNVRSPPEKAPSCAELR
eukprot:7384930-Prymnesium_polylepis.3